MRAPSTSPLAVNTAAWLTLVLLYGLVSGCGARRTGLPSPGCRAPSGADELPACVVTAKGLKSVEHEYIPGVIDCELGTLTASPAALDAQAIAARTYLLKRLLKKGKTAVIPTTARFQCWRAPRHRGARESALRTAGVVMQYSGGIINANYVSGARHLQPDCTPMDPKANGYEHADWPRMRQLYLAARAARRKRPFTGTSWTEVVVTRNAGQRGDGVEPSPIASPGVANRGALAQWATMCLAEQRGYGTHEILKYFYGEDVELTLRSPPTPPPEPTVLSPEGVLVEKTRPISAIPAKPQTPGDAEGTPPAPSVDKAD